MDQIISVIRRCLPFCFPLPEIESEDQNEATQVVGVEGQNEDVQSNSITRSTSSSSQSGWDHHVFLSFRGEDTRKNFTDHLYSALDRAGINTFRDDEWLDRGESISRELLNKIRRSRISIVVFSKGYASSTWCLDELAEIVNCKNTVGHTLFPIFYHVDPSDVRKQTKTFAKAFIRHEKRFQTDMKRVQRWREALTEAAECSGWDLESLANGYESQVIDKIVEEVLCKVNPAHLDVAIHPVGIKSYVKHIKALLNLETNDVRIVGFYGMGGIGKTTLAKAIYNEICHGFQGSSFLFNVKEQSKESNGLVHLQEQLLYDILHKKNLNVYNVDSGITMIKERIRGKKVLVVLDDVDHLHQLHALVGLNFKLFGPGSRLIATTRDEQLLDLLQVDEKYKVNKLNHWESLRLFKWHAFQMTHPIKELLELSVSVVKYTGGLPLALVVLGSSLCGKSVAEWISKLEKLQKIPDGEIQKKLETSLDSLEYETRVIFLDIACFFISMEKEYVIKILLACDFCAESGLGILIQRSLVTIEDNKLRMHDLIRDMGRGIVYAESPYNPGRRSRLWFHEDVVNVLSENTGSEMVEGLILNHNVLEGVPLKTEAFKNMKNLRLLKINNVHLSGSYEDLSKVLKWLCWHKCHLKFLPQDFHLENLVILDMQKSNLEQVWKTKKCFNKLKILKLSNSKYLTTLPNFSQVPELEILILEGCTSLVQVHESIGHLKRLVLLNLQNCTNLKYLPRSLEQLPSSFGLFLNLKAASFVGCSSLIELPNFLHVPHLEGLNLGYCTSLVEIHESIGVLKSLVLLNLQGCMKLRNLPSSISNLNSLETLNLSYCNDLEQLPEQLGNMTALKTLNVGFTAIEQLPSSFNLLKNLEVLSFRGCKYLIESPEFLETSYLKSLTFRGCESLVKIHESIGHLKRLEFLELSECKKLRSLPISSTSNLESLESLILSDCSKLDKLPEQWGNMKALFHLDVDRTAIEQLSSPNSSNQMSLLPIFELGSLAELDLSGHNLSEDEFPIEFECLSGLKMLKLSRNNFRNLPSFISCLPKLKELYLNECTALQSISLPRTVYYLKANDCTSLERVSIMMNESSGSSDLGILQRLFFFCYLNNCHKLVEIQNLERLQWMVPRVLEMRNCNNLSSEFRNSVLQMMCQTYRDCYVLLPGSEIPNWISHQAMGSSVSFRVPPFLDGKMGKVLSCFVYAVDEEAPIKMSDDSILNPGARYPWRFCNKSSRDQSNNWDDVESWFLFSTSNFDIFEDHIFALVLSDKMWSQNSRMKKSGDEIEASIHWDWGSGIECPPIIEVKRCGIHFVVDDDELSVRDDDEISESESEDSRL